jgi:hypothetical protein
VYKWHTHFSEGIYDIKDAERSERPSLNKDIARNHIFMTSPQQS